MSFQAYIDNIKAKTGKTPAEHRFHDKCYRGTTKNNVEIDASALFIYPRQLAL
jgi:hypothetical protein